MPVFKSSSCWQAEQDRAIKVQIIDMNVVPLKNRTEIGTAMKKLIFILIIIQISYPLSKNRHVVEIAFKICECDSNGEDDLGSGMISRINQIPYRRIMREMRRYRQIENPADSPNPIRLRIGGAIFTNTEV
jgi:hypothetical protein